MSATGARGQQLKLRLFLEGIEVPVIGAQVQMNLNAPATASIQVIPVDTLTELKPRTMVHLFYWDYNYDLASRTDFAEEDVSARATSLDPDVQLDNYKLLYGGEVVGLVMAKSPMGRQAILQCADWSTYWDTTYQTFISWTPNGNWMGDNSAMWAGGNNMFHNLMSSHASVMTGYLKKRPKTEGLQNVTGLMGGIISLLEAMGGVDKHVSGINDYFTIAESKNHLMQQLTADQTDNTSRKLFAGGGFGSWMNRKTTHLGELVSFRDMLKLLFKWIYYEVVPVPAARFVPAIAPEEVKKRVRVGGVSAKSRRAIGKALRISRAHDGSQGVIETMKKQTRGEARSAKEVRDIIVGVVQIEDKLDKRTRGALLVAENQTHNINSVPRVSSLELLLFGVHDKIKKKKGKVAQMTQLEIKAIGLEKGATQAQIDAAIAKKQKEREAQFLRKSKAASKYDEERRQYLANQQQWDQVTSFLEQALGAAKRTGRSKVKTTKTKSTLDRLQTQIFRPDCFFVAPPKCNVLFPDQITSFQYQRNFLQEVTRLRLTTGTMFTRGRGGGFFQNAHMAPNKTEIRALAKSQGNKGIRTLLPWEIFTGILPKFEHIAEVNYISNKASKKRRKIADDLRGKGKAYAQRAAYFNFTKYRFAPRSISVSAKFSPQFVLGFPALIIDKPYILEPGTIKSAFKEAGVSAEVDTSIGSILSNIGSISAVFRSPTQYLGMPAGLSHAVDQNGGVTSATLTHARVHKVTDDDYLDSLLVEVKKGLNTTVKSTELDAVELLARGDYKKLNLLIKCTPQAAIHTRIERIERGENPDVEQDVDAQEFQTTLSERPSSAPTLNRAVLATLPRINTSTKLQGRLVKVSSVTASNLDAAKEGTAGETAGASGTKFVTITGGVAETTFLGTNTTIFEPSPYGPIGKGSKGPNKGQIKHVQVPSNAVLSVSASDIDGFVRSRRDKKAIRRRKKKGGNPDTFYMWRKVIIHEEVTSKKTIREVPIEEALRPPWFSPQYSNLFIGEDIYKPFFGVGSVVDQSLFLAPGGAAFFGDPTFTPEDKKEMLGKIQEADGDLKTVLNVLDDYKARGVGTMPSIEASVDALAFLYGEVRRQGLDVQKFVADYTSRPIATLRNIFGSLDLEYGIDNDGTLKKISGEGGFHSTAVAPFGDLLGLVDNPDLEIARIRSKGKKFPISRALDPRPGRREKVEAYASQIGASSDSLGVGILG